MGILCLFLTVTASEQPDNDLRQDDPSDGPSKLVVQVVLVQNWGSAAVNGTDKKTEAIQAEEAHLRRQCQVGAGDTKHDRCESI